MTSPASTPSTLELLGPFGFTETEALVYEFLLREGPATGYRISHGIGKSTANTYKALRVLVDRGALALEDAKTRLCRAVPPEELMAALEHRFQERKRQAVDHLSRLHQPVRDERIYHLEGVDHVVERARSMLARASQIVLVDAFPAPLASLGQALEAAIGRGVTVAVQVYQDEAVPGALTVRNGAPGNLLDHWPGQQLSMVVDASEHLLALFSGDGLSIHQAIWSESTWLSCMHHNHLACELALSSGHGPLDEARRASFRALSLLRAVPPGLQRLQARFRD